MLAVFAATALLLVGGDDPPLAPDGKPGLGAFASAREYGRSLVDPTPEQRAEVEGWLGLEPEIRTLSEKCVHAYRERGAFAWLAVDAPAGDALGALHARFHELEQDPLAAVRAPGPAGASFARAFLDPRFRLRLDALEDFADEARELRGGLTLLRATQDGYVDLKDAEARDVARRVDLAASMLRAIRLDLLALPPEDDEHAPGAPDPAWIEELRTIARANDPKEREARLDDLVQRARKVRARVEAQLFLPALREKLAAELGRRQAARERGERAARQLRPLLPETAEGAHPPPDVAAMKKNERYASALRIALEAMGIDPMQDELAYAAGLATDFIYDRRQSRAWFDRYLALHGLRSHESVPKGRKLTDEEQYALSVVQSVPLLGR